MQEKMSMKFLCYYFTKFSSKTFKKVSQGKFKIQMLHKMQKNYEMFLKISLRMRFTQPLERAFIFSRLN